MTTLIEDMAQAYTDAPCVSVVDILGLEAALRVVIASLRQPNSAMIRAGDEFGGAGKCKPTPVTEHVWHAMLSQWEKENAS